MQTLVNIRSTFDEQARTYAVKKQSAEKKKNTPFEPMSDLIIYGKTSVRMNYSGMVSWRQVLLQAKGMTYTKEPL